MKTRLLLCAFVGLLMACQPETAIQPGSSTLAQEVTGLYRTNAYLDPSHVAMSAGQMPYVELKAESDSSVTLAFTKLYPVKASHLIDHVALIRQSTGIQLRIANESIGTLQTDRIFTSNGMEKQGKLLRINLQNGSPTSLYFAGFR